MSNPPVGNRFEVEGRQMMLHRLGDGRPTVVLDAGAGMYGLDYLNLQQEISKFATCVAYDRAGLGWSDPAPEPQTAADVARSLHSLLEVAELPGPYVLVAHSLGGYFARRFAQLFPDDTAGLVQIDPAHEDIAGGPELELTPQILEGVLAELTRNPGAFRDAFPLLYAEWQSWDPAIRDALLAQHRDPAIAAFSIRERTALNQFGQELRAAGPLPDVPLVVLTAGEIDGDSRWMSLEAQREILASMQAAHATLAASVPRGEQRVIPDSGHWISVQRPDAIIKALHDVLTQL